MADDMANDLTARLSSLNVYSTANRHFHHQLQLCYPDMRLLPEGARLHLEIPYLIHCRVRPDYEFSQTHLDSLDYTLRLGIDEGRFTGYARYNCDGSSDLVSALANLCDAPGKSTLHIVSYKYDEAIRHRFRLTTTWGLPHLANDQGLASDTSTLDLSDSELANQQSWGPDVLSPITTSAFQRLSDLMSSTTDHAYLHMLTTLEAQFPDFARSIENARTPLWDTAPYLSARELVEHNMLRLQKRPRGHSESVTRLDLDDCYPNEIFRVRLPCGHEDKSSLNAFEALSDEDCLAAHCRTCKRTILTELDLDRLEAQEQRDEWDHWLNLQSHWTIFDHTLLRQGVPVRINGVVMAEAVQCSLGSLLVVPSSVMAAEFVVAESEAAKIIYDALTAELGQRVGLVVRLAPEEMLEKMMMFVQKTVKEKQEKGEVSVPKGFDHFVKRWMLRAVNHAATILANSRMDAAAPSCDDVIMGLGDLTM